MIVGRAWARRTLHASSGLLLLIVPLTSWETFRFVLMFGAVGAAVFETLRLASPAVRDGLAEALPVFRAAEAARPSGAFWLAFGYAATSWFPPPVPAAAILVAALADPAASLVGARWGGGGRKTWVGTAAVLAVSGAVLAACVAAGAVSWRPALAAALGAAALERWSGPIDDNLLVAPGVAALLWLLA